MKDLTQTGAPEYASAAMLAVRWALATVFTLIVLKAYAYFIGGSMAMLASLTDSLGDAVVSIITFASVRLSLKPADEEHRFGHGKIEGFSALIQAAFLGGAAVFLTLEAVHRLSAPRMMDHYGTAMTVSAIAIVLSLILTGVQAYALKRAQSLAIEADQKHYASDIFLNTGVIIALLTQMQGGPVWIDTAFGILIAVYLAYTAFIIGQKAFDMLMDRELPQDLRNDIKMIITAHKDVYGVHDLRTRRSGMNIYISFDVELDPDMRLEDAHAITREIENQLLRKYPHAEIIIHKDPRGDIYDARHKVQGVHH